VLQKEKNKECLFFGLEEDIRIAVLKDEVAHLKSKLNDEDTSVSILKTTISTLQQRVREMEKNGSKR